MPTHTIPSALIKLSLLGIPWNYSVWQEITGVYHGLFPDDPKDLPKGWTAQDASDIQSLFSLYDGLTSEDARMRFLSQRKGTVLPGRKKWKDWVNSLWRSAKLHDKIVAVFSAQGCHPLILSRQTPEQETWPSGQIWIPTCLDAIAVELFGEDCLNQLGRLPEKYRLPTQALAQRTWSELTRRLERAQQRSDICEEEAVDAFNALHGENLTKAKITTVIRAVAKWHNIVKILEEPEDLSTVKEMETELERLMQGLGAGGSKKKGSSKSTATPRLFALSSDALKSLATAENVQDVISLYHEYFDNPSNADDDVPVLELHQPIESSFGTSVDGADTGAEYEAKMTPTQLAESLGFVERIPLLFNNYRHTDGLSRWSNPEAFVIQPNVRPTSLVNLELHWHQLAGVHAIIRTCFTPDSSPDHCTGVLVADEVGLGKTYQAATVIAFLADAVIRQREGLTIAPLLERLPYLRGEREIPCLPHLIIAPGTLVSQWLDELHILFAPGGVDIFTYPTSMEDRQSFWNPEGPFHSSKHALSNRIILSPHSGLQKDYDSVYTVKIKKSGDLPWTEPSLRPAKYRADIAKTLFGQQYLSVFIDEAHNFRNHGAKHKAALMILQKAVIRGPLSATPLQTSTKDLAAMGRLTGIEHFSSAAAYEEEKEDARALRRARRESPNDDDNEQGPVKLCQVAIAQRMQRQSQGHILRRTTNSLNWKGEVLVPLPPCETIYVYLDLTERELKIITANGQSLEENVGTANVSQKLITRGFYMEYRLSVIYARARPNESIPVFKSLDEWYKVKSTKLDMAARLCQYLLARDNLPLPTFANGTIDFPHIPPVRKGERISQLCKIVVFTEFPSMISLFTNIFKLYGIKVLAVNGTMSYDKRASVIKTFRENPAYRVLALSSVGTTGINLAFCRVIIFLDQPWSAQDIRQMRGRVHRQPQKNKVLCIHLLANDTADILVAGMAEGKRDMMEAYLSKEAGQDMFNLLSGGAKIALEGDDEPTKKESKKFLKRLSTVAVPAGGMSIVSKGKATIRPSKQDEEEEEEEEEVAVTITPKDDHRRTKAKSKEFIDDSDLKASTAPRKLSAKSKSKPAVSEPNSDAPPPRKKSRAKSKPAASEPNSDAPPPPKKSRAKSKPAASEPNSDAPPPPKKSRAKSKPTPSEPESDAPPKKSRAKSKPTPSEPDSDAPPPPKKSRAKSKPAASEPDSDAPPPPKESRAKSKPAPSEPDSDAPPPPKESRAKSKPAPSEPDSDAPPPPKKSRAKSKPTPSEPDSDAPPPPKKSRAKSKPTPSEPDSDAPPPPKKSRAKSKPTPSEPDSDASPTPQMSAVARTSSRQVVPEADHPSGNLDEPDINYNNNENDDDNVDGEDEDQDQPLDRDLLQGEGYSTAADLGDDEEDDDEEDGEEVEEEDNDDEENDDEGPAHTEVSSSNFSARSRSRATSSDCSMLSEPAQSDFSMHDLTSAQPHVSTPPNPGAQQDFDDDVFDFPRKRSFQNASPPSPTEHRGRLGPSRRRISEVGNEVTSHWSQPRQLFNDTSKGLAPEEAQPMDADSELLPALPIEPRTPPSAPLPPLRKKKPIDIYAKRRADMAEFMARNSVQSAARPPRDANETYSQLLGHSASAASGPSSASTSLPGSSLGSNTTTVGSGISAASTSAAGPSRRGPTIPTHRLPAAFDNVVVAPPPALPPKKINLFSSQYRAGAGQKGQGRGHRK